MACKEWPAERRVGVKTMGEVQPNVTLMLTDVAELGVHGWRGIVITLMENKCRSTGLRNQIDC